MIEENHAEAEKVRQALGEFLDRLAKAVADSLARTKQVGHSKRRRSAKRLEDGTKSSE